MAGDVWRHCRPRPSTCAWQPPARLWRVCLPRAVADSKLAEWLVYAKPPFSGPRQVLKYLARYTHRVAISNQRLVALEDGRVTFRWKNYARAGEPATMTLKAGEFIRRFLLHVLPKGFIKVRHFDFPANRGRRENVVLCHKMLDASPTVLPDLAPPPGHSVQTSQKPTRSIAVRVAKSEA